MTASLVREVRIFAIFDFFFLSRILRFFKLSAYLTRFKVKLEEIHITISWLSATFSFPRMNSPCAYKKKKRKQIR